MINISVAGFGQSKGSKKPGDRAQFLASFIKQEKMGKPVLVSPSMSGSYAIPYLFQVALIAEKNSRNIKNTLVVNCVAKMSIADLFLMEFYVM